MKKFWVVLAALLIVCVAAIAIFVATFDLNRYRPLILKQIKAATGKEARIGRIALTWKDGLAARADGLALFDSGDAEPDASLNHVVVKLKLGPLLRKEIRVSGVVLSEPKLVIERSASGEISVAGIRPTPSASTSSADPDKVSPATAAGALAFSVDSIKIENASIRFIDHSPSAPVDLSVSNLDADIKNVSLAGPVSFSARAAIAGSVQNIAVGGKVTPPQGAAGALLEDFSLQVDLASINLDELHKSMPTLRSAGLQSPLGGLLEVHAKRIGLDPTEMTKTQARVTLKNGTLSLTAFPVPLEALSLDAQAQNGRVSIKNFSARVADGKFSASGDIQLPQGREPAALKDFTLQADLSSIDPEQLFKALPALRESGLKAPLSGVLEARISRMALDPKAMLNGEAHVSLENGTVTLSSLQMPLEGLSLDATLHKGNLEVKQLATRIAGGSVSVLGGIQDLSGQANSAFRVSVKQLSLAKLARVASPRAPRLEGTLSLDFEGRGQGLSAPQLTQSLDGQGRLALQDGVLVNSNLLRTLVDKISKVPGVGEAAISRIPPQYLAKINEPSTILRPFEMPFAVQQGRIFFEQLNVPTELFILAGAGSVGFDRSLAIQGAVVFDPGFSQSLMAVAPPTQYFVNQGGSIQIQATIEGTPPNVIIKPNLDAALQRVGAQVVSDLLQKKDPKDILSGLLGGPQPQQAQVDAQQAASQGGGIPVEGVAAQEPQPTQAQSTEDALIGLLGNALKKNKQE